ncbi:phage major capsid protein [Parageobacillus thermoglucosidasius]|uniref:phage major capsid protein n=1 Tax=Parageobacillus thermoglucosidasius TaxID=1426 RepID=UPI0001D170D0|nr:phage major capsid protein [Parageobacillus thermoglucosidasius]AEH46787.1 phage major capsid protein, HK97 family [Parageobacillus thermoglucosidasius C56-YS93]
MPKELRELLEQIQNKKEEARKLLAENKIEEAKKLKEEIMALQEKFDIAKELYEEQKQTIEDKEPLKPTVQVKENEVEAFVNHIRTKFRNAMSEGSGQDGGYTVPQDIQTKINELRESKDALQNLILVEPVTTLSGSRVFKKRSQQTGFVEIPENGEIPEKATPQFTVLQYQVKKYAGFFRVTNELLKDSTEAIVNTLIRWIGDESRVTRNKLILSMLGSKAKTAIANVDDIKAVLNVQLDPVFRYTSSVITNQDGFNWLDTQKDANGNYLLQPSVSSPTGKQLFGVPVVMVSNKVLPSDTTNGKAPIIIGDLQEGVVMFDRQTTEIMSSDVAMDAFQTDVTLWRAIEREEVKLRDDEAFVYGEVTLA